ncbi:MAG: cupin domain-containing protein [Planctomycetes bacterium]|nr:cupin domain-containing protein [Planctomycetota bacterium]
MNDPRHDSHHAEASSTEAALYALGALPPVEARAVEAHAVACDACAAEVRRYREVAAALAQAAGAPGVAPPRELRAKLLQRVAAEHHAGSGPATGVQVWKAWSQPPQASPPRGLVLQRAGEGSWEPTELAGVSVKRLRVDVERRYVTMLVRMEPGASYPSHQHAGAEECYVLEGDLHVGEYVLRAGDYQYAEEGSEHGDQWTESGCLLLIASSQEDRLL